MSKADGSVIINTRLDTKGLSKGVGNLKSQFAGLGSVVGKLGGMIAAAFSARAIVNFGKEVVKLGSDLQEVQNVVDVTFTTMNEQVNQFAKSAMQTAGLSETMAKRYTGTFGAMAKSFKFTEEDAYAMATSLTQLSGDVASFYNLTQDEAYTKLKSVFTGETETLKDLGVVMTQTALDDFALRKGLSKTTSQMSEQEKVALRYQFVMEQLSGASGDFMRTQDSWANQTRILTLQFEQLKATIGQGLINVLTPVLKIINDLLARVQILADKFRDFTTTLFGNAESNSAKGVAEQYAVAAEGADNLAENTEKTGKAAKKALAGFDELNILSAEKGAETSTGASTVEISTNVSVGTVTVADGADSEILTAIAKITDKIKDLIEPLKKIDLNPAKKAFSKLGKVLKDLGSVIANKLEWVWFNVLVPLAEWTIEKAVPVIIETLAMAFDFLGDVIEWVWPLVDTLINTILWPLVDWATETIVPAAINLLGEAFDFLGAVIRKAVPFINKLVDVLWDGLLEPLVKFAGTIAAGVLDGIAGFFDWLSDRIDPLAEDAYILSDAEAELAESAKKSAEGFRDMQSATEEQEDSINNQMDRVTRLWQELDKLVGANGRVLEADKARVQYILNELNDALGTEYEMVGDVVSNYQALHDEIENVIAAKKANLLLEAHEDDYKAAIEAQEEAWDNYQLKLREYNAQREHFAEIQKKYAAGASGISPELVEKEGELLNKKANNLKEAKENYLNYTVTISEYEEAHRLILEKNYDEATKLLLGQNTEYTKYADTVESETDRAIAALEEELAKAKRIAEQTKFAFDAGVVGFGQEMVDETAVAVQQIEEKLLALQRDLQEAGEFGGEAYSKGIFKGIGKAPIWSFIKGYGTSGTTTMPALAPFSAMSLSLPYLAKGSVIPPNAPFAAILGDQKHGTNIEAPLSTIQEAVAEVMADYEASNLAGHEATVEVLQQLLAAVLGIEVGDTTIGQAANRYNRRMAITTGGL